MVELIGELRRHDFDVWIISASNVWSVRWMVARALNPLLEAHGAQAHPRGSCGGVSTLLQDTARPPLQRRTPGPRKPRIRGIGGAHLRSLRLTSRLQYPVPTYAGKIGCIWDAIGRRPYLAAGDSPGDHAMLSFSEHRLWIARMENPAISKRPWTASAAPERTLDDAPVLGRETPGFLATFGAPPGPVALKTAIQHSHRLLRQGIYSRSRIKPWTTRPLWVSETPYRVVSQARARHR